MSSLRLHTLLSPQQYATLLFVANVTQQGRRGRKIGSSDEPWNKMLQDAGLRDRGVPGCAEATTTKVNVLALKEEWDGEKELRRDLQFIRIGMYAEGETITAGRQCNLGVPPPPNTRKLRSIQRKLAMDIEDLVDLYGRTDKVRLIKEWVDLDYLNDNDLHDNPSPEHNNIRWSSNNIQTEMTEDTGHQEETEADTMGDVA